jgi:uncharacterized protein YyaL (SSP411 family)
VGWLEREMIAEGGAFAASLDADSEGEEGRFYVWSRREIAEVLGEADARLFCAAYDVTEEGNWEGRNILNRLGSLDLRPAEEEAALAAMRARLLARRGQRVRPGWDDKVLADWNGLAIAALTHAARIFERPAWLERARTAFAFVTRHMEKEGRLIHAWRAGEARGPATAGDYASMIWGALRLYQAAGDAAYLEAAERWTAVLDRHYWLPDGGYAFTADDTPDVIVRMHQAHDDATPNANALMVSNLVALNLLTGKPAYAERAHAIPTAFAGDLAANTFAHCGLIAAAFDLVAPQHVVVMEPDATTGAASPLARALLNLSLPGAVEQVVPAGRPLAGPALAGKTALAGRPTAYACLGARCSLPVTEPEALVELLRRQRAA